MISWIIHKLKIINPWHFLWISVVLAEILVAFFSTIISLVFWGRVTNEVLLIGLIDAFIIPLIIAPIVIYSIMHAAKLEKITELLLDDITERKKAEDKFRDANRQLKETQEQLIQAGKMTAMGQLAAGISHELNQPLTGIKGFAQAILMELKDGSPIRRDLNRIVEQADRMDKIIRHIRLFASKSDSYIRELDIEQPIEDALLLLTEQLKVHNIHVKKSLSKNLPRIQGDPNQLEQVFLNLIANARDAVDSFSSGKGGEIIIQSTLSNDKKHVIVTFKDTGCGISQENLDSVFNPFYTTKSPDGGMGLGLSIVYRIIENHGGSIEVDSKGGRGTTFRIMLPVAQSAP